MRDMFEALIVIFGLIVVLGFVTILDKKGCSSYQEETGRHTKHEGFTCFVETESGWYTTGEYKAMLTSKEGK